MNRHIALRLEDLSDLNRDLLKATEELVALADASADAEVARQIGEEVRKLSDVSRRLTLATRSIAQSTAALLEAS